MILGSVGSGWAPDIGPQRYKMLIIETSAKIFNQPKVLLIYQYVVEQAASPAIYSRGRLFYIIFAEVSTFG